MITAFGIHLSRNITEPGHLDHSCERGITHAEEDKSLILRQKMDLNKCLTKVSDLAKYKEVGLSTTFAVVTGCIPIRKWQI